MRRSSSSANLWSIISSSRASFASNNFSKSPKRLLKSPKRAFKSAKRLFISVRRSVIRLLLYKNPTTTTASVPTNVAKGRRICTSVTDEVPASSVGQLAGLLYGNAFSEVSRLVDIATAPDRNMIREQLQRNHLE